MRYWFQFSRSRFVFVSRIHIELRIVNCTTLIDDDTIFFFSFFHTYKKHTSKIITRRLARASRFTLGIYRFTCPSIPSWHNNSSFGSQKSYFKLLGRDYFGSVSVIFPHPVHSNLMYMHTDYMNVLDSTLHAVLNNTQICSKRKKVPQQWDYSELRSRSISIY